MEKIKRLLTATLAVLFLVSLAGCIVVDRGGRGRYYHNRY
jgi:hypothetical protein